MDGVILDTDLTQQRLRIEWVGLKVQNGPRFLSTVSIARPRPRLRPRPPPPPRKKSFPVTEGGLA